MNIFSILFPFVPPHAFFHIRLNNIRPDQTRLMEDSTLCVSRICPYISSLSRHLANLLYMQLSRQGRSSETLHYSPSFPISAISESVLRVSRMMASVAFGDPSLSCEFP